MQNNPMLDSAEELVETIEATENETIGVETDELEGGEANAEVEQESSEEDDTNGQVEKNGVPKGVQKKIDKLTRQKHELKERTRILEQQLEQTKQFLAQPEPENLEYMSEGERIKHYTQKSVAENNIQHLEMQKQQVLASHKAQVWEAKKQERLADMPDFEEAIASTAQTFRLSQQTNKELMQFIEESDVGVDVAYYLAKNPDFANSLEGLSARAMDRKLMRLEDKLEASPIKPTKPITKAKAPISSGKPVATTAPMSSNTRDFWRNVGKK